MKMHVAFVVVMLCVASVSVNAFPAQGSLDDDAEVIVVPLEKQNGNGAASPDVYDSASDSEEELFPGFALSPASPFHWNFRFFDSFEEMMRRMRERVANAWNSFPQSDFSLSIDGKPNATTSTVQIINGHKVVVNDTVYQFGGGNSVVKHRVIKIQPIGDDDSVEPSKEDESTTVSQDSESTEETRNSPELRESDENSINNNDDIESFEPSSTHLSSKTGFYPEQTLSYNHPSIAHAQHVNRFFGGNGFFRPSQFNRLNFLHQRRQPVPYFQQSQLQQNSRPATWESIEDTSGQQDYNSYQAVSPVDAYESVPVDLSNDIDVNQMLADQGAPTNPDAEVFAPETFSYNQMIK